MDTSQLPWPVDVLGNLEESHLTLAPGCTDSASGTDPVFSGLSSGVSSAILSPLSDPGTAAQFTQWLQQPSHGQQPTSEEITEALRQAAARATLLSQRGGQSAAEDAAIEELRKRKLELQEVESKRSYSRSDECSLEELREKNEARLMRNRLSAKQSRERKKAFVATLEQQVHQLLQTKIKLEQIVQQLTWENERLRKDPLSVPPSNAPNSAYLQAQLALPGFQQ